MKKYSDKIKEYEDTDYMAGMIDKIKNNDVPGAAADNVIRNDKIDTLKMPYKKLDTKGVYDLARHTYGKDIYTPGQKIPSMFMLSPEAIEAEKQPAPVPVNKTPTMVGNYDINTDFEAEIQKALSEGNYGKAAELERLRNEKIGILGLSNPVTDRFNYLNPYQGELDRQQKALSETEPFSYDYKEDEMYKSILNLKEKEAEKAYNDSYAQLSRQFDGDIPVNMLNKLNATKAEIIDQADGYIPTLYQMAREASEADYNKKLMDYNLTKQRADEDYARWLSGRDFTVGGLENKYSRDTYADESDYNKKIDERNHNEDVRRYEAESQFRNDQFEYEKGQTAENKQLAMQDAILNTAISLFGSGLYGSPSEAVAAAIEMSKLIYK